MNHDAIPPTAQPAHRAVAGTEGETRLMTSTNFEFLRPNWPELAGLGGFAESYSRPDPESALVKLPTFGEQLTEYVYQKLNLPRPYRAKFNDLLGNHAFEAVTPRVVLNNYHAAQLENASPYPGD